MSAPVAEQTAVGQEFRRRLLDGLAASIEEHGYRDTTVADIVRHARTSKRTFYDHFPTKEQCFFDLLTANNVELVDTLRAAVDPSAPWRDQVRQAVSAYVGTIEASPAITLSWIRELPALGAAAADAYRTYRRRQHGLRLRGERYARVDAAELAPERAAVGALWSAVFGH